MPSDQIRAMLVRFLSLPLQIDFDYIVSVDLFFPVEQVKPCLAQNYFSVHRRARNQANRKHCACI